MVDFSTLTPENINMFAIKHYDNPLCVDEKEFLDDMKRFKYLKRLFRKYETSKDLKMRLVINHIIILANVFGVDAATTLLFFKIEETLSTKLDFELRKSIAVSPVDASILLIPVATDDSERIFISPISLVELT